MSRLPFRTSALIIILAASTLYTYRVYALEGSWYAGAGGGLSRLTPDTDGSSFTLDDDRSTAAGLYLGLDVNRWLSVEAAYTDLGKATLSEGESVDYSALSIGGVAYVLGESDARYRQEGWSGYLRFGLNRMSNDAGIELDEENNIALWLGAGMQWPAGPRWGFRTELVSFDGDAQAAMASVYWRQGAGRARDSRRTVSAAATRPVQIPAPSTAPPLTPAPVPVPPAAPRLTPSPLTVIPLPAATADSCVAPVPGEPVDIRGCALFTGLLQGVDFVVGTSQFTPGAQPALSRLANNLSFHPSVSVEIQVYSDDSAGSDRARELSRERAIAVARYLVEQGIDVARLKARAFGASQPQSGSESADGRRLDNRVELRVL